jgi:hypothetical protein
MHPSPSFEDLSQLDLDEESSSDLEITCRFLPTILTLLDELYQERLHDTVCEQIGYLSRLQNKDRKVELEALFNDLTCKFSDFVKGSE